MSLSDLLADHQEFHSDLQMDSFITARNGGTLYGCYKQCLRELMTRVRALQQRYTQRALVRLEIDEHEKAGTPKDRIHAASKRIGLEDLAIVTRDSEREFIRFYGQAVALREALAAEGVTFPIDDETRDRLDREMWEHNLKSRVAVEFMSNGRMGGTTIELIFSSPPEMRKRIGEWLKPGQHDRLIEWFENYDCPVPQPKAIELSEVPRLIGCST